MRYINTRLDYYSFVTLVRHFSIEFKYNYCYPISHILLTVGLLA